MDPLSTPQALGAKAKITKQDLSLPLKGSWAYKHMVPVNTGPDSVRRRCVDGKRVRKASRRRPLSCIDSNSATGAEMGEGHCREREEHAQRSGKAGNCASGFGQYSYSGMMSQGRRRQWREADQPHSSGAYTSHVTFDFTLRSHWRKLEDDKIRSIHLE